MYRALRLTFHVFLFLFGKHRESANIQLLNITFLLNSVDHNLGIVAIYYWICEPTKVKQYVPLWGLQVIWIVRVFRFRPANIKGDSNNPWCQNKHYTNYKIFGINQCTSFTGTICLKTVWNMEYVSLALSKYNFHGYKILHLFKQSYNIL